jgi:small membrane protein
MPIQFILILIIVVILSILFLKYKKGELVLKHLLAWMFFWLIALTVVVFPNLTNIPAGYLGIGRGADLVVYFSLIFIFYFLFKFLIKLEKIEKEITRIVRKIALDDYDKRNEK